MAKKKKNTKSLYELKGEFVEDMANAIENDEIRNDDPLEDLEEANGKEIESEEEAPDLGDLEYADGKVRDEIDLIEEKEKIFGINTISPFGTADRRVWDRKLENMDTQSMQALAERVGARQYGDYELQSRELNNYFADWVAKNGNISQEVAPLQETIAEKGALSDAFEGADSVKDLEAKLKSKTLSDLQATAARLGFNPGFDRSKLITVIKQEYQRQS